MRRYAAVAGQFYAGTRERLIKEVENCFLDKLGPQKLPKLEEGARTIKGAVVPHAGYAYSGAVAAHVYYELAKDGFPETFVIIGPNHSGYGAGVAVTTDTFVTPLGDAPVDMELAKKITKDVIIEDTVAHRYEHSIEVQLPFLLYIKQNIKFVPLCMGIQDYEMAKRVGTIIGDATKGEDVVVIASSDFTHYEPQSVAYKKDKLAIAEILNLNPKSLYRVINTHDISACGYGPIMAMLFAVKGSNAVLLKYGTSGDVSPMSEVVGYGAILVK